MVDMLASGRLDRCSENIRRLDRRRERGGDPPPARIVSIETSQFDAKTSCLQLVEAAVPATRFAHVPLAPAVLPVRADPLRDTLIVRHYRSAVTQRPEVLGRIETERRRTAERTHEHAVARYPMR